MGLGRLAFRHGYSLQTRGSVEGVGAYREDRQVYYYYCYYTYHYCLLDGSGRRLQVVGAKKEDEEAALLRSYQS